MKNLLPEIESGVFDADDLAAMQRAFDAAVEMADPGRQDMALRHDMAAAVLRAFREGRRDQASLASEAIAASKRSGAAASP